MAGRGAVKSRRGGRPWGSEREDRFFEELAAGCNVTRAASEAGVSSSGAYRRRQVDASFRARWREAISIGYSQVELMLLERALHGTPRTIKVDGEMTVITEYCDRTALTLLRMHRDTASEAETEADPQEVAEASERILARLARLREQLLAADEASGVDTVEIKAAIDWPRRIGVALAWQARGARRTRRASLAGRARRARQAKR